VGVAMDIDVLLIHVGRYRFGIR